MSILLLTADLMFTSRVQAAAASLNVSLQLVPTPAALPDKLTADCRLVFIDLTLDNLNLPAAVKAIHAAAPSAKIVAYGPHVDHALLADATEAGCHQVLTRGQFDKSYRDLLASITT
jgi:DNA-binding NarL/FixJ family response regulator